MKSTSRGLEKPKILAKAAARGGKVSVRWWAGVELPAGTRRIDRGFGGARREVGEEKCEWRERRCAPPTHRGKAGAASRGPQTAKNNSKAASRIGKVMGRVWNGRRCGRSAKIAATMSKAYRREGQAALRAQGAEKVRGQRSTAVGTAKSPSRASGAAVRWREGERTIEKLGSGATRRARVDVKSRTQKMQKRGCEAVRRVANRMRGVNRICEGGATRRRDGGTVKGPLRSWGWRWAMRVREYRELDWWDTKNLARTALRIASGTPRRQRAGREPRRFGEGSGGGAWGREGHHTAQGARNDAGTTKNRRKGSRAAPRAADAWRWKDQLAGTPKKKLAGRDCGNTENQFKKRLRGATARGMWRV
ncbi:hypothetical protein C8J57DRAFT_1464741 [Mycena rebaudengoi]|nr:hypothetical protein C8J57DRAFT_1464741 [Mycena rebaudengoi]